MPTGGCDVVPEVARPAPGAPSPPMLADAALLGESAPPPLPLARQKELYEINKLLHMELISCYIIQIEYADMICVNTTYNLQIKQTGCMKRG